MERDFLVDFLGDLERDLLDLLGVRGEGDLMGQTGRIRHQTNSRSTNSNTGFLRPRLALMLV